MSRIKNHSNIFMVSPTESLMTKRGNRHPVLASELIRYGYHVSYLTTNYYHAEKRIFRSKEIDEFVSRAPYEVQVFPTVPYDANISVQRLLGNVKTAMLMYRYLLKHCTDNDIILVPSRPPEFVLATYILQRIRNIRVALDVRDIWPDGLPLRRTFTHKLFQMYCKIIFALALGSVNYAMYTAPSFLEWLRRYNKNCDADFFPLGFDEFRWQHSRPLTNFDIGKTIKFAFVGDIAQTMKMEHFIEAIACKEHYSLTFIGGGERLEAVRKFSQNLGAKNVQFLGFVSKEKVVAELQKLHISIIPMAVKYVMPNKLFDSIAAFRPVLVFGENDAATFVRSNDIGWVLPFDVQQSSKFIETLTKKVVVQKSNNIARIRKQLSKEYLYKLAVQKIVNN